MIETCQQYVDRRLSEGWKVVSLRGNYLILSTPDGRMLRTVDLRNDTETLRPNAAGDETSINNQEPGTGSHYDKVDEAVADDEVTFLHSNNTGYQRDLYSLPASSGSGIINFIKIYFRCTKLGADGRAKPSLKSSGIVTDATETLRPNAAGDETGIDSQQPDSTYHYDKVDEASADDNTTYVQNDYPASSERDLYNLPAHSVGSGTINFVKVYVRCRAQGSATCFASPSLKSNGTVTDGTETTLTQSFATISQQWNTNPADSAAWEWADIDALQVGVKLRNTGLITDVRCTQVYVEVNYTPGIPVPIVTDGTEVTPANYESWSTHSQQWDTNPADSTAWEWADIDALQIGVSIKAHSSAADTACTQVYVEVDYTPGWTGKISGVTNPAKIMGVDVANIAKVKGVPSA